MTCVLLAEDDTSISEPLARALRREGYDVDVSADGPGTLEAALAGGLDLIVLNDALEAGAGFEVDTNRVTVLDRDGGRWALPLASKAEVAEWILDRVEARLV